MDAMAQRTCLNKPVDVLVVGAGFAGSVVAERLASCGQQVVVIDKRMHIGGNAFDERDSHGVLVHRYGPHIFHTNSERVWKYLSRFTEWTAYEHRVRAYVGGQLLPIPINRDTVNRLYGWDLDETEMERYLASVREHRTPVQTSEDVVLSAVGRELCNTFFRGYTRKQWGLDLSELSPKVLARIPTRTNCDDRYFTDRFQAMPTHGFTDVFLRLLSHTNITVLLGVDFKDIRDSCQRRLTIYTGPIDEYFEQRIGRLPYRSLRLEHEHVPECKQYQPVAVVNYPNEHAFTRITEFKHLTGQQHSGTSIVREYPTEEGEPYYPVPRDESAALLARYQELARAERGVSFLGRLGCYQYLNMDQVIASALNLADTLVN